MTRKANPVIVGGVVKGVWARTGNDVTVTWLDEQRRPDVAINQEAGRLADVLGRDLQLRYLRKRPAQRARYAPGREQPSPPDIPLGIDAHNHGDVGSDGDRLRPKPHTA